MPIYEFYCARCHRVFRYFSRRVDTESRPDCPRCGKRRLERQVSLFACARRRAAGEAESDDELLPDLDVDPSKLERAMEQLSREAEGMDEEDPRQVSRMVRRLYESMGLKPGGTLEESLRRLEAGEDPDAVEEELGDALEGEDPFAAGAAPRLKAIRRLLPPAVDEELYDL